jgi:hypothetical protein
MGAPSPISDLGSMVSWVGSLATNVVQILYQILTTIGQALWAAVQVIWSALEAVFSWLGGIFKALMGWMENAVRWLFSTALPAIRDFINKIVAKVQAFLQPLINYLKMQIQAINQLYNNVIRPFMNLLQRLRGFLMIFRLFHLRFAQELDQYLAGLEARINGAFLAVQGDIGRLLQWVEWIASPAGLLAPANFLLGAINSLSQLWALLRNLPSVALGAQTQQQQQTASQSGLLTNVQAEMKARAGGLTATDLADHAAIVAGYQKDGYTWVR